MEHPVPLEHSATHKIFTGKKNLLLVLMGWQQRSKSDVTQADNDTKNLTSACKTYFKEMYLERNSGGINSSLIMVIKTLCAKKGLNLDKLKKEDIYLLIKVVTQKPFSNEALL